MERGSVRWHRGGWELRVRTGAGQRVTRRHQAPNTRAGRRSAEDALEALVVELTDDDQALTVARLLDRHIAAEGHRWAPSTRSKAPGLAASIAATPLGSMRVVDVRPRDIREAWTSLRELGRSPGTIRRYHSTLSSALTWAVADLELIAANPARSVRLSTPKRAPVKQLPPIDEVLAAVERIDLDRLRSIALVALGTGARRGELAGLCWSDVDLDAGTVHLTEAISDRERSGTKAGPGRTIGIEPATVAALRAWRPAARRRALALGHRMGAGDPIWSADIDPTAPWHPPAISRAWGAHRRRVALTGVRFHDLRHVHATALLRAGVPVHVVSHRLGHASTQMTHDVYSHVIPADDQVAVDALAKAMRSMP